MWKQLEMLLVSLKIWHNPSGRKFLEMENQSCFSIFNALIVQHVKVEYKGRDGRNLTCLLISEKWVCGQRRKESTLVRYEIRCSTC